LTIAAILFDLDGTLVDTAPDLVAVLNRLLDEHGEPPMPYALARNEASNGALGLIRLGFGTKLAAGRAEELRGRFIELYSTRVCEGSRLFVDIERMINNGSTPLRWGVVTNKPHALTLPLLEQLDIARLFECVVSGDSLAQRKPHPAPLLFAAEKLGVEPQSCVYIGDAVRDVEAARAAGMQIWVASWGYIRPSEDPARWEPDQLIRHPRELEGILSRPILKASR
jgi:phosphoglycolate phosphatase